MADWDQLREVGHQVTPPPFDSLVNDAAKRDRRARVAVGAASLAAVFALGFGLALVDDDDDGTIQPVEEPSSPTSTATRAIELPDGVLPLPEVQSDEEPPPLDAGRYQVPLSTTLALEIDLPQDTRADSGGLYLQVPEDGILKVEAAGEEYGVPTDVCTAQFPLPAGPTVQDLVDAIRDVPLYRVSRPEAAKIGGAEGTYLEIRIPSEYDSSPCEGSEVGMPGNPSTYNNLPPGYIGRWWILDVEGQRVVIQQFCDRACPADTTARFARAIRSITFTSTG